MAIGRMTNYGRRWQQAVAWTDAKPGASSDGDVGLTVNGSAVPSFWVVLLTTTYNFTAQANGPNPDHATIAALGAGVITPTGNYTDNDVPRNRTRIATALDDSLDQASVSFIAGQEPFLTVSAAGGLTNIAGFAICTGILSTDNVLAIVPFASTIASVAVNNRIKILDTSVVVSTS